MRSSYLRVLASVTFSFGAILAGCDANEVGMSSSKVTTVSNRTLAEQQAADAVAAPDPSDSGQPEDDGSKDAIETPMPLPEELTKVEREFNVSNDESLDISYSPDLGVLSQDIVMRRNYTTLSKSFIQTTRSPDSAVVTQGHSGTQYTQTFQQANSGILDLQVVIDDSSSMGAEQKGLADKLASLLTKVAKADWRINVATTDISRGGSRKLIRKDDATAAADFEFAINAGLDGSGNEEGIRMAVEGLKWGGATPWLRDNSTVAVLIVSDEDNCSSYKKTTGEGTGCAGKEWAKWSYLTEYLSKPKANGGLGRKLGVDSRIYALVGPSKAECATVANVGTQYMAAVAATGGVTGNICDADYTTTLERISTDLSIILKNQFVLSAIPDSGSLVVKVNGVETSSGYTISGKTLTFTSVPPAAATITVAYVSGSTPINTRFNIASSLRKDIYAPSLHVKVGGQDVTNVSYIPSSKEIVFTQAPASDATIVASFKYDDALMTRFSLGAGTIRSGSVVVKVNNAVASGFSLSGNDVVFATAPGETASIDVSYDLEQGSNLSYPLTFAGSGIHDISIVDKASNNSLATSFIANGLLKVAASEFVAGRIISVRYKNNDSGRMNVELPQVPLPNSFVLTTGRSDCALGQGITLVGKSLSMDCDWDASDVVQVKLKYSLPTLTTFLVEGITQPEAGSWDIKLNGQPVAFERTGAIIQLSQTPAAGSVLKVTYLAKGT